MKRTNYLVYLCLLCFSCFILLSVVVAFGKLNQFDYNTTKLVEKLIPGQFDPFLSFLSLLGSLEITTTILFIIVLLFKKVRSFLVFFFYGVASIVEVLGKFLIYHPGPPSKFFRYDLNFLFPSSYIETNYSYPSGHSLRMAFIFIILSYVILTSRKLDKTKRIISLSLTSILLFLMLISRVSLGEHWTTDVLAGAFLGISCGILTVITLNKYNKLFLEKLF